MGGTKDFFKEKKEWSIIKDDILGWYLTPYLSKLINSRKDILIVDCFAGKGKFDIGGNGSPLIICEQAEKNIHNKFNTNISVICIEKENTYFRSLTENIKPYSKFCSTYNDTFENIFDDILKISYNKNVFFYIDPYGIKSLDFDIFSKMKNNHHNSYEILMNFNTFGFLREGCRLLNYKYESEIEAEVDSTYEINRDIKKNYLDNIANGNYWRHILERYNNGYINMMEAEELFIEQYLNTLEQKNIFKYTLSIPIRLKQKNMLKYRLVFGTNHIDGLILMCDNMNQKLNYMIDKENCGQISLFSNECFGVFPDADNKTKEFMINIFKRNRPNFIKLENLYYILIKEFGINNKIKHYNNILKEFEKTNLILVERDPAETLNGRIPKSFDLKKYKIKIKIK